MNLSCGAWYDPADGSEQALCLHGNSNVLTRDQGTSKLGQGPSSATALVEVERWNEPLLPVAAFDPRWRQVAIEQAQRLEIIRVLW